MSLAAPPGLALASDVRPALELGASDVVPVNDRMSTGFQSGVSVGGGFSAQRFYLLAGWVWRFQGPSHCINYADYSHCDYPSFVHEATFTIGGRPPAGPRGHGGSLGLRMTAGAVLDVTWGTVAPTISLGPTWSVHIPSEQRPLFFIEVSARPRLTWWSGRPWFSVDAGITLGVRWF